MEEDVIGLRYPFMKTSIHTDGAPAAIGVASLPRGALVEIDCILYAG